jgi:hypothetical protein
MIIGICGFIGSGKDTVADYLVNFHEFRRESFANTLKDAISAIFGWDRTLLEGRTRVSREWREQEDEWWSQRLGIKITPRFILQNWGTDIIRKGFHDDVWIASLENKLRKNSDNVVISDCRFPNEIKAIRNQGGIVLRVVRGPEPEWYDLAVESNHGSFDHMKTAYPDVHASETAWVGTEFDAVLDNNATLDQLYKQVNDLLQDLRAAKASRFE